MRPVFLAVLACACGRIGYDGRRAPDATPAAVADAAPEAPPMCAGDMLETSPGGAVCIEIEQRGTAPWTDAKADCEGRGRRLCADAEWLAGCVNQPGLVDMIGDYEWVAEEEGGVAQKRGSAGCDDASAHDIVDPYGYRCCGVKQ